MGLNVGNYKVYVLFLFFLIEMEDKGENLDFGRKIVCMYYVEMELP